MMGRTSADVWSVKSILRILANIVLVVELKHECLEGLKTTERKGM